MADETTNLSDEAILDLVEENQDFNAPEKVAELPFKMGETVYHSSYYIRNVLRGNARDKAKELEYEVIGCTARSVTVKPKGSPQKYGPQFPHKYIAKERQM